MAVELLTENELKEFSNVVDREIVKFADEHDLYPTTREPVEMYNFARSRIYDGGKRFRPALTMATCKAFSGDLKKAIPFAYIVESVHGGYLDIDDVMDRSPERRGKPTTFTQIGDSKATLVGMYNSDAVPFNPLAALAEQSDKPTIVYLLRLLFNVKRETQEGQYMDISARKSPELTTGNQMLIYIRKTGAYTFGGPAAGGARIGGASDSTSDEIYRLLRDYLGPGFQIQDDLLNLEGNEKYGKEFADDLNEGKPTEPVATFNERASQEDKTEFYNLFGRQDPALTVDERIQLRELMDKYGAREKSKEEAKSMLTNGFETIKSVVPQIENSREFYSLLDFAVKRNW